MFKLTEKLGVQLRFDSSNIFNHTNLAAPNQSGNTNIDQSNAGQITNIAPGGTMAENAVLWHRPLLISKKRGWAGQSSLSGLFSV